MISEINYRNKIHFIFSKTVWVVCVCVCVCVCMWVSTQSYPTQQSQGLWPTRLLHQWDFPGKNTGVGCHFPLQEMFLIQGLNLCLLHLLHW